MKKIFKKPYLYWGIGIFIFYEVLNFIASGFYNTIKLIFIYASNINWLEIIISVSLSLIIGALVAINGVFVYIKYKERKKCKESGLVAGFGTATGLATGFCPLCITGIFPIILGLLGFSFSFASLPFKGIEIQVLAVLILLTSLWMLNRKK